MRLVRADIRNFRSLADVSIDFDPPCRVLVGINESGKSNILRALSMLEPEYRSKPDDVREPLPDENPISSSSVRFVFRLSQDDKNGLRDTVRSVVLSDGDRTIVSTTDGGRLGVEELFQDQNEGLYVANVVAGTKYSTAWNLGHRYRITGNWRTLSPACPRDYMVVDCTGRQVPLTSCNLVCIDDYPDIPSEYLIPASLEVVSKLINPCIGQAVETARPEVVFWKYDEANLLPPDMELNQFAQNPASCVPLRNMFELAGIEDIQGEITAAQRRSVNGLRNLLGRVATQTTRHFRKVWKEYRDITFGLEPNGTKINASVVEKNHWSFSQRSDGFKRFVSFLLLISARVKANGLENTLLLIDEPDAGLHPSGARYLRDELIHISRKNIVVYATHSIFMIDKEYVQRHYIVTKENETTSIKAAGPSNVVDEEVIYNALRYSAFDSLKPKNIIFEGWRDKKLYLTALKQLPKEYRKLGPLLKPVGVCHGEGVKLIDKLSAELELASRKCTIISDSDQPAKDAQKRHQQNRIHGDWYRYDELLKDTTVVTSEDFLTPTAFTSALKKVAAEFEVRGDLPDTAAPSDRLKKVRKWLRQNGFGEDDATRFLKSLKGGAFDSLTPHQIASEYYSLLAALADKIPDSAV